MKPTNESTSEISEDSFQHLNKKLKIQKIILKLQNYRKHCLVLDFFETKNQTQISEEEIIEIR